MLAVQSADDFFEFEQPSPAIRNRLLNHGRLLISEFRQFLRSGLKGSGLQRLLD